MVMPEIIQNDLMDGQPRQISAQPKYQVQVDCISVEEWARAMAEFKDSSIYQTWHYGAVHWGEENLSHLVLKRDGAIVSMAQFRIIRSPLAGVGVAYLRWGPIWRTKSEPISYNDLKAMMQAIREEYSVKRKLLVRIIPNLISKSPEENNIVSLWNELGFQLYDGASPYRTIRVDISRTLDEIRKNFDGKWRNQLNRAERNELRVAEGTELNLYRIFEGIYTEMYERKQFDTTVDPSTFKEMQQQLLPDQKMLILIAYKDQVPISALVGTSVGETGVYLLGATSNEGMKHKGAYLLQWRMIQLLKERGCKYYDLGGINPESNPGVYHFKSGFGGEDITFTQPIELAGKALVSKLVDSAQYLSKLKKSALGWIKN
jgi:lipid II:glycine glycyltransferase (peptidoglycan interpeptide bridge formation enzyme)